MKIMEALAGISRIFLDTAPVIYLVEALNVLVSADLEL
jgi:hypothetical protein